jgi:YVTN family beta-propeller protein
MRVVAFLAAAFLVVFALLLLPRHTVSHVASGSDFAHFEGAHVHPLAITPDGTRLLAVNTPDARLVVFDLTGPSPVRIGDVPVGLEPVSVAARGNGEAWVVNTLSDDVSIVDLATLRVRATLRVGDEPSDVVFAGSPQRAWVSVSQEDAIKVFDPADLAAAPAVIAVPARWPRALAVSADGAKVYCAIFNSNHRSTVLSEAEAGDSLPPPNPPMKAGLPPPPKVGLIVNFNGQHWVDESGKWWDSKIKYQEQLVELVEFDAATRAVARTAGDIATVLMGTAVNPVTGAAAVTGTYARTEVRFEPNLRGHLTETRLAIWPTTTFRTLVQVNPHIDYAVTPGPQSERDSSLGLPTGVAWSPDGQRLFVTALASGRMGVFDAAGALLARVPTVAGPTGVLADPARGRIYVLGRFRGELQTLSNANFASLAVTGLGFDPTPDEIVNGRKFFYGGFTSGHGDEACASCHLFGDFDNLAWDLGNPQGDFAPPPPGMIDPLLTGFHPMKGPMVTQSLRGLPNTGLLHWRGDRADLGAFNPAFVSLMGRSSALPDTELAAFSAFVLPLLYPPNPNQNLDRSFPDAPPGRPSARRGRQFYLNNVVDGTLACAGCHALPSGTNGQVIDKAVLLASQDVKVPQLRNLYKKSGFRDSTGVLNKRGFGFTHNGSIDNLFDFLHFPLFNFGAPPPVADGNRRDVEAFLLAFDTGTAPAVGAQVTFDGVNNSDAALIARMDTLVAQADSGNCDLIAKGRAGSTPRGWKYAGAGTWISDVASEPPLGSAALRALAGPGHELTVTGVPPNCGTRMGVDRDRDGFLDGDELAAGTDPGDPASHPSTLAAGPGSTGAVGLRAVTPNPFRVHATIDFTLGRDGAVDLAVYDLLGREVRHLARAQRMGAGIQRIAWDGRREDGRNAGPGVYFVRLRTGEGAWSRMVVRLE